MSGFQGCCWDGVLTLSGVSSVSERLLAPAVAAYSRSSAGRATGSQRVVWVLRMAASGGRAPPLPHTHTPGRGAAGGGGAGAGRGGNGPGARGCGSGCDGGRRGRTGD